MSCLFLILFFVFISPSNQKIIYFDEHDLTIIKYLYENLFNLRTIEQLNMYCLDFMEDKLEYCYTVYKLMVLDYGTDTNY